MAAFFVGVEGESFLLARDCPDLRGTTFGGDRSFFDNGASVDSTWAVLEDARPTPAVNSGKPDTSAIDLRGTTFGGDRSFFDNGSSVDSTWAVLEDARPLPAVTSGKTATSAIDDPAVPVETDGVGVVRPPSSSSSASTSFQAACVVCTSSTPWAPAPPALLSSSLLPSRMALLLLRFLVDRALLAGMVGCAVCVLVSWACV